MVKIAKFGGSSVANAEQFKKVKSIIDADGARKYIVTSACGKESKEDYKVTDLLYIAHTHMKYKVSVDDIFEMIENKYYGIKNDLGLKIDLKKEFDAIKENMMDEDDVDYLVSRGEYLTAMMLAEFLGADFVDAKDVFKFNYDKTINMEKDIYLESVGKYNPRDHLESTVEELVTDNLNTCLTNMLNNLVFK